MSCDLKNGRLEKCKDNFGGIKNIYVINFNDLPASKIKIVNNVITNIGGLTPTAYRYELISSSNSFTETQQGGAQGLISYSSNLTFTLKRSSSFDQGIIQDLISNRHKVCVEYNNGTIRFMGLDNGVIFTSNNTSGNALNSFEGYQLTAESLEGDMAPFIDDLEGLGIIISIGEEPPTPPGPGDFVSQWRVNESNGRRIILPLIGFIPNLTPGGVYNGQISWGDGTVEPFSYDNRSHIYAEDGDYTVRIIGELQGWNFTAEPTSLKDIINIIQWGSFKMDIPNVDFGSEFEGATNLNITATDTPDLSDKKIFFRMFKDCDSLVWNSSINDWDMSGATDITSMFEYSNNFNQDLNSWDVSNVINMAFVFRNLSFNGDISDWDVSNATNIYGFSSHSFNGDVSRWDVSNVTNMSAAFGYDAQFGNTEYADVPFVFNGDLSTWVVNSCDRFNYMFCNNIAFNRPLNNWVLEPSTSSQVFIEGMFQGATSFNQPLDNWDVSNTRSFSFIFRNASSFNQDLSGWDTTNGITFRSTFDGSSFNGDVNNWKVFNSRIFSRMFANCPFNQPLNLWSFDSTVRKDYTEMFKDNQSFNQFLNSWGFTTGTLNNSYAIYDGMFENAIGFNQDISSFYFGGDFMAVKDLMTGKDSTNYNSEFYDNLLQKIDTQYTSNGQVLDLGMGCITYTSVGAPFRASLINKGWTITDCGEVEPPQADEFISVWRTTNYNEKIVLPLFENGVYNAVVDWGDGSSQSLLYNRREHIYNTPGDYTVKITGRVEGFSFFQPLPTNPNPRGQIREIKAWGAGLRFLTSTPNLFNRRFFATCVNLDITATDVPSMENVSNASGMFDGCDSLVWNEAVNDLDTSNITDMSTMFRDCGLFNQDLDNWNTSNVTTFCNMFYRASTFNGNIATWDTTNVTEMCNMFYNAVNFNSIISNWDTSNVEDMSGMFQGTQSFNRNITGWNTSNVTTLVNTFRDTKLFNSDIGNWDTSNVTDMQNTFSGSEAFNQNLDWDTSNVVSMKSMFQGAQVFNSSVDSFDTSNVTDMSNMFRNTVFNQTLIGWDTTSLTVTNNMFQDSIFNQPIDFFDTSNVVNMNSMFKNNTIFNQPLDNWDTEQVLTMGGMFENALAFDQPLGNWSFLNNTNVSTFMNGKTADDYSAENYCILLDNLANQFTYNSLTLDMGTIVYFDGCQDSIDILVNDRGWDINDGGDIPEPLPTIFEFTINNNGDTLELPYLATGTYSGTIDYGDGTVVPNTYANRSHTYATSGVYNVTIDGDIDGYSNYDVFGQDQLFQGTKLTRVLSWGDRFVLSRGAFWSESNLIECLDSKQPILSNDLSRVFGSLSFDSNVQLIQGIEDWDTSNVEDMNYMFSNAIVFNQNINSWDVSNVQNMNGMFRNCELFNQPLDNWNTSNVTEMAQMFFRAIVFNQPLNTFDTSNVTRMDNMFFNAEVFNQNINSWDVSNVTRMTGMFAGAIAFDQPIGNWNTSNVTRMSGMFSKNSVFNQNINSWNTSSVEFMSEMFRENSVFNQPLNDWDTSSVKDMAFMFARAKAFNQPLSNWDTSNVEDMAVMFSDATAFNQSINNFTFDSLDVFQSINNFMDKKTDLNYDAVFYDEILINLDNSTAAVGQIGMGTIKYTAAGSAARASLVGKGWDIDDGGQV